jgi:hypothetical protein
MVKECGKARSQPDDPQAQRLPLSTTLTAKILK